MNYKNEAVRMFLAVLALVITAMFTGPLMESQPAPVAAVTKHKKTHKVASAKKKDLVSLKTKWAKYNPSDRIQR